MIYCRNQKSRLTSTPRFGNFVLLSARSRRGYELVLVKIFWTVIRKKWWYSLFIFYTRFVLMTF